MKIFIEKHRWSILRTGLILGSLLILVKVFWPMSISIWKKWRDFKNLQVQVIEAYSWKEVTRQLKQENDRLRDELSKLYRRVPQEEALSNFIQYLQKERKKAKLELIYLKPYFAQKVGRYQEVPVELELKGKFHDLGRFLSRLENSNNIIQFKTLKIKTRDMLTNKLNIHLKLSIILIKSTHES